MRLVEVLLGVHVEAACVAEALAHWVALAEAEEVGLGWELRTLVWRAVGSRAYDSAGHELSDGVEAPAQDYCHLRSILVDWAVAHRCDGGGGDVAVEDDRHRALDLSLIHIHSSVHGGDLPAVGHCDGGRP